MTEIRENLHVLAVVPSVYNTSPGQRYRIEQWEPLLNQKGLQITYAPFESQQLHEFLYSGGNTIRKIGLVSRAFAARVSLMASLKEYDAIYVFREAALLGPAIFERLIYRSGVPMIFDFDDAVFVSYRSPSNGYLSYLKFAGKTKSICRMASHVMAGNPYLASYARQVNDRVTVIPTTIDTDKYTVQRSRLVSDCPVIGWTGSYSTVQHLDKLRPALQELAKLERFRLRVIGTSSYKIDGLEVDAMPWRAESELDDLRPIDIGIMPLPDDPWSKGKCALKALQFMALGIPTVCSPVGVNTEVIKDGENGYLAATPEEWIRKLRQLLQSINLRERLGLAGRKDVEEKYSARVQAPCVYEIFKSVVSQTQNRKVGSRISEPQIVASQPERN